MKLNDLNEAQTKIVKFSDIGTFDNWSPRFWIEMEDYINQYKKLGKDAALKLIGDKVKKIGEKNYNSIKDEFKKEYSFGIPEYKTALNPLKMQEQSAQRVVIMLDAMQSKTAKRKSALERRLKELQKEIDKLG